MLEIRYIKAKNDVSFDSYLLIKFLIKICKNLFLFASIRRIIVMIAIRLLIKSTISVSTNDNYNSLCNGKFFRSYKGICYRK